MGPLGRITLPPPQRLRHRNEHRERWCCPSSPRESPGERGPSRRTGPEDAKSSSSSPRRSQRNRGRQTSHTRWSSRPQPFTLGPDLPQGLRSVAVTSDQLPVPQSWAEDMLCPRRAGRTHSWPKRGTQWPTPGHTQGWPRRGWTSRSSGVL